MSCCPQMWFFRLACLNYSFSFDICAYTHSSRFLKVSPFLCTVFLMLTIQSPLCETFLDLLRHTLSSCLLHIPPVLVIWYFLHCLVASVGFNFAHMSNLSHQLDCDLLVGRSHTFYFVISSLATGQSMCSIHTKLAASEQDLSLPILVATQSQLRPIAHMNGESLIDNNAENISRCLWLVHISQEFWTTRVLFLFYIFTKILTAFTHGQSARHSGPWAFKEPAISCSHFLGQLVWHGVVCHSLISILCGW